MPVFESSFNFFFQGRGDKMVEDFFKRILEIKMIQNYHLMKLKK